MTEEKMYEKWSERITKSEKAYREYHDLIKEIREYYKNGKQKNKSNLFWSSVETLKPFLYFKTPKVYIERKNKTENPVESVAVRMLEKALKWDLEQFDFDSIIKYARNDYLLSGMGILYERYVPTFKTILAADDEGNEAKADIIDTEKVVTEYIDPKDFIADSEKVGIWEKCQWVARCIDMTKDEVVKQFGAEFAKYIDDTKDRDEKNTKVYEIWDKPTKSIIYYCKDFKKLLKVTELPDLASGFPMPKPIYTTLTNDSLVPVPDYSEIKSMLNELDGINERMRLTMKALKVSGCYDNSFPELAEILSKDVTLVSLSDFDRLKEAGGIAGIIDFMPIDQYINALASLAQQRKDVVQQIYEITGVSDIMRGNSDPMETATAVNNKTSFGTLRNQDRQNDMQRFITDLLKIKAEMICEQFQPETLAEFAPQDAPQDIVTAAVALLREDKTRDLSITIETDRTFEESGIQDKTVEAARLINELITKAFDFISQQPLLLPLYKQMVQSVVMTLPNTRQFEPVIDDVFSKIQEQLSRPSAEDETPDADTIRAQAEVMRNRLQAERNENELRIRQEQNQIKRDELAARSSIENGKLALTNKEMEYQRMLKEREIAQRGTSDGNITTGYVKGF